MWEKQPKAQVAIILKSINEAIKLGGTSLFRRTTGRYESYVNTADDFNLLIQQIYYIVLEPLGYSDRDLSELQYAFEDSLTAWLHFTASAAAKTQSDALQHMKLCKVQMSKAKKIIDKTVK